MTSMSAGEVLTSGPVWKLPPSEATSSEYRSRSCRRSSPSGRAGTASTALPPPKGKPTAAILSVIAADSRIASSSAAAGSAYAFIRVPPPAGPRRVEWRQTNIHVPLARSKWTTVCSPSQARMSSSSTPRTYPYPSLGGFGDAAGGSHASRVAERLPAPRRLPSRLSRAQGAPLPLRWAGRELTRRPHASHSAPHPARPRGAPRTGGLRRRWAGRGDGSRRRRLRAGSGLGHRPQRPRGPGRGTRQPAPRRARARRSSRVGHAESGGRLEGAAHGVLWVLLARRPGPTGRALGLATAGRVRVHRRRWREHRLRLFVGVCCDAGMAPLPRPQSQHRAFVLQGDRCRRRDRRERDSLLGADVRLRRGQRLSATCLADTHPSPAGRFLAPARADSAPGAQVARSRAAARGCLQAPDTGTEAGEPHRGSQAWPCFEAAAIAAARGEQAAPVGRESAGRSNLHRPPDDLDARHA